MTLYVTPPSDSVDSLLFERDKVSNKKELITNN